MPILLIFLALWGTAFASSWSDALTELSSILQTHCVRTFGQESPHQEIYQALICGKRLSLENPLRQSVAQLGLIHLLVVSGAHLIWLEYGVRKMFSTVAPRQLQSLLSLIFVFCFAFICGLQAPVLRSASSLSLRILNQRLALNWLASQRVALSALICLPFLEQGLNSLSLQLSWSAALALSFPLLPRARYRALKRAALVYIFLTPLLLPVVSLPHPLSIVLNGAIAGALLSFWLGCCLLQLMSFLPGFGWLADLMMGLSLEFLAVLTQLWPDTWNACLLWQPLLPGLCSRTWGWAYLGALQSFILSYEFLQRRKTLMTANRSLKDPRSEA